MAIFAALKLSLAHQRVENSNVHLFDLGKSMLSSSTPNPNLDANSHQFQTRRTLIIQSVSSESVNSDSGVVEVKLLKIQLGRKC